jgi:hypothetical protein
MLTYDTDMEEYAYHKSAEALLKAAHAKVDMVDFHRGQGYKCFYNLGEKFAGQSVFYFTWHGDDETALFFKGSRAEVFSILKNLDDRPEDDMGL